MLLNHRRLVIPADTLLNDPDWADAAIEVLSLASITDNPKAIDVAQRALYELVAERTTES